MIVVLVVVADRITKMAILHWLDVGQSIPVIPGFFSLTYIRNPGAAFGLLARSGPWRDAVLVGVAIVAALGLGWLLLGMDTTRKWERAAAAAVIGGALGNLYDRLSYGEVVDFLDVYVGRWHWPAFNVADSCITIGVGVLIWMSFLTDVRQRRGGLPDASPSGR